VRTKKGAQAYVMNGAVAFSFPPGFPVPVADLAATNTG